MTSQPHADKMRNERKRRRELLGIASSAHSQSQTKSVQPRYTRNEELKANESALAQCDKINEEIDGVLDNCLVMTAQSAQMGADIHESLHDQRGQIKRIR